MEHLVFGLIVGSVVACLPILIIWDGVENISIIKRIALTIIVFSLCVGITSCVSKVETDNFNNGYCPRCETKYKAVSHQNGRTYYECPNCYYGTYC